MTPFHWLFWSLGTFFLWHVTQELVASWSFICLAFPHSGRNLLQEIHQTEKDSTALPCKTPFQDWTLAPLTENLLQRIIFKTPLQKEI